MTIEITSTTETIIPSVAGTTGLEADTEAAEPSISVMQAVLQMQREQMYQKAKVSSRLRQPMAVPLEKQVCMKVRK